MTERGERLRTAGLTALGLGAVAVALVGVFAAPRVAGSRPGKPATAPASVQAVTDRGGSAPAPGEPGSSPGLSDLAQAARRAAGGSPGAPGQPARYTDLWYDDSGYILSTAFSAPIADHRDLTQITRSLAGRGKRGIAQLQDELAHLPPGAPSTPARTAELLLEIGRLFMYDGAFADAVRTFETIKISDLRDSPIDRWNLEVLLGVASLRLGETENCVNCQNESSCIFPLAPEAIHKRTAGSRAAIGHFTAYLDHRPDDVGVRWLLNVAYMTLGEYPDKVPTRYLMPLEPFQSKIDVGRMPNVADRVGLNPRGADLAGGCIVDDFTGDGLCDVFRTTVDSTRGALLLVNRGNGLFENRSESAGLTAQIASLNCVQGDFDNDGRLDVLLLRGGWETARRMSLLRNRGDGSFDDVTITAGLAEPIATQAAGWADYDNDGWLDLYVAGEHHPDQPDPRNRGRLYHNRGDGTFENVAPAAGVENRNYAKGMAWGDYNNDGYPDLYVSNLGQPNRLYRNNRNGTFTDVAAAQGVLRPTFSFACWFWDYDNDGRLDLYVNPYGSTLAEVMRSHLGDPTDGERPRLYHNEGLGGFRDVTTAVGLDRVVLPMGSNFGDLDNDGFLDLYLGTGTPAYSNLRPNRLFKNVEGRRFEDVTTSSGTGHLQKGHGVSFTDWDHDGDVDLFLVAGGAAPGDKAHAVLFQNPGHGHHWLNVRLVGVRSNRAAFGATIRVDTQAEGGAAASLHRVVGYGSSFGGNSLATTIGLGRAGKVPTLEVHWPTSGTTQTFHDVPVDRAIEVTEGAEGFRLLDWSPIPLPPP